MRGGGKGGGVDHKSEVRLGIHPARTPPRRSRGNQPGAHRATDLFEPVWEGRLLSAPPRTFARGPGRSSDALWSGRIAKESVRGPWHSYSGSIFDEAAGKKLRSGFGTEFLCISAAQGKRVPKYLVVVVELMAVLVTGAPGRCCFVFVRYGVLHAQARRQSSAWDDGLHKDMLARGPQGGQRNQHDSQNHHPC